MTEQPNDRAIEHETEHATEHTTEKLNEQPTESPTESPTDQKPALTTHHSIDSKGAPARA
jgi:hypothetical protein